MANGRKRSNGRNGHSQTVESKVRGRMSTTILSEADIETRLPVLKTYKIYVGGKFPRTESGRYYLLKAATGDGIANMCLCSRKDFREAVVAARAAQTSWGARAAFNRSQILYRIAEMLEGRASQFVDELV